MKHLPGGAASSFLHSAACAPGARLLARRPAGRFTLDLRSEKPAVLLSAGIGCTPLLAMLEGALPNAGSRKLYPPPLVWVHCARDGSDHPFADHVQVSRTDTAVPSSIFNFFLLLNLPWNAHLVRGSQ